MHLNASLILLASVALALTVQAKEANNNNILNDQVILQLESDSNNERPPKPEVTAPRVLGEGVLLDATGSRSSSPMVIIKADAVRNAAEPEVTAPRGSPGKGIIVNKTNVVVKAAAPEVTSPRKPGKEKAPLLPDATHDAAKPDVTAPRRPKKEARLPDAVRNAPEPEVTAPRDGSPGKRVANANVVAVVDVAEPEVTSCARAKKEVLRADAVHPVKPKVTALRRGVEETNNVSENKKMYKKKIVEVIVRRHGQDIDEAEVTAPGPKVTAPAPQVTVPVVRLAAEAVTAPGPEVTAPHPPVKRVKAKVMRVNGKAVKNNVIPDHVTAPGPEVTAPAPRLIVNPLKGNNNKEKNEEIEKEKTSGEEMKIADVRKVSLSSSTGDKKEPAGLIDGLLGGLLGIDLGNGKKKKTRHPTKGNGDGPKDWDHLVLYGDDGYVARPLPVQPDNGKQCPTLPFLDQMIWDQQGPAVGHDNVGTDATKPPPQGKEEEQENEDSQAKQQVVTASSSLSLSTEEDVAKVDEKIAAKDDSKTLDTQGISICLLGPCNDDDEDDEDDERIKHKQKKFLKQFKGKALNVDTHTGCPIPSEHK
ncbi:hypothetical protein BG004_003930 [Podila humilis]|nr:hypothetical protein BG004_003930 [Podila humilis]